MTDKRRQTTSENDAFAESMSRLEPARVPDELRERTMARCESVLLHGAATGGERPRRALVDRIWRPFWAAAAGVLIVAGLFHLATQAEHRMNLRLIALRQQATQRNEAIACLAAQPDAAGCASMFRRTDPETVEQWARHMRRMAAGG